MSQSTRDFERSAVAGESLTAKQFYIVQLDATGKIEVAEGATDLIVGVLQNAPDTGEQATYRFIGTTKVIAGGAIAIGAMVTTDANGKAVSTTTDGDVCIGRHIGTAAAADGDIVEVQMSIQHLYIA
jgi:hypothetical protein